MLEKESAINQKFGGLKPDVENVIFVNSELDPANELTVQSNPNNRTFFINIAGKMIFEEI